jgi:hypothetical protein
MGMGRNVLEVLATCATVVVALLCGTSCEQQRTGGALASSRSATDSMGVEPKDVHVVTMHAHADLVENSAAVMSARQRGVVFTINDSGNDAVLFAFDTTGANRGSWRVEGATNVDWESASLGPCVASVLDTEKCIYIGDTGDNQARHPHRTIYRVAEPRADSASGSVTAEKISYTYADGPHDVEAMYVATNGDVLLLTKRGLADASGRLRPSLVFRLSAAAWGAKSRAVAELVDSLPIVPGSAPLREITDASLSPDARHLAVRTYTQVFIFVVDSLTGRVAHSVAPAICNIVTLGERQGEGITWADNRGRLVFTSEGRTAPLYLATCPLPAPPF